MLGKTGLPAAGIGRFGETMTEKTMGVKEKGLFLIKMILKQIVFLRIGSEYSGEENGMAI